VEPGELVLEAARREVFEEVGANLTGGRIVGLKFGEPNCHPKRAKSMTVSLAIIGQLWPIAQFPCDESSLKSAARNGSTLISSSVTWVISSSTLNRYSGGLPDY